MTQPKLLLIADHPQLIYLIRRYAEQSGCLVFDDGRIDRALELARRERPAMVLLYLMPDVHDDWSSLRRLRSALAPYGIPITIISAIADEARARRRGCVLALAAGDVRRFSCRARARRHSALKAYLSTNSGLSDSSNWLQTEEKSYARAAWFRVDPASPDGLDRQHACAGAASPRHYAAAVVQDACGYRRRDRTADDRRVRDSRPAGLQRPARATHGITRPFSTARGAPWSRSMRCSHEAKRCKRRGLGRVSGPRGNPIFYPNAVCRDGEAKGGLPQTNNDAWRRWNIVGIGISFRLPTTAIRRGKVADYGRSQALIEATIPAAQRRSRSFRRAGCLWCPGCFGADGRPARGPDRRSIGRADCCTTGRADGCPAAPTAAPAVPTAAPAAATAAPQAAQSLAELLGADMPGSANHPKGWTTVLPDLPAGLPPSGEPVVISVTRRVDAQTKFAQGDSLENNPWSRMIQKLFGVKFSVAWTWATADEANSNGQLGLGPFLF